MLPTERLVLLGLSSLAALASFAGVLAVLGTAPVEPRRAQTAAVAPRTTPAAAVRPAISPAMAPAPRIVAKPPAPMRPGADRFAYAPLNDAAFTTVSLRESALQEPVAADALQPPADAQADETQSWIVEMHAEPKPRQNAPRVAAILPVIPKISRPGSPRPPLMRDVSLQERLAEISPGATTRLAGRFQAAKADWPPAEMVLLAIKDEKVVELHARARGGAWKLIHSYPVLAASGVAGPKLRQGDRQVPEGIYAISFLNPNSRYHVSLRVNYPNAFDRQMASQDGRSDLGGDIMIHGKAASVGCLAVGDPASEELFVLAAQVGLANVKLIIAPTDFRRHGVPTATPGQPPWVGKLYTEVASAMADYKRPPSVGLLSLFSN